MNTETNADIRQAAKAAGVRLWQIADKIGIADSSFSRRLRYELPNDKKQEIFAIITKLQKEQQTNE